MQILQPCSDVHPVAEDALAFLDHIPQVDPDAELHAPVFRAGGSSWPAAPAGSRPPPAPRPPRSQIGEEVVARRVHHPAAVLGDDVLHHPLESVERADGPLLVLAHKAAVALHIRTEDGGELAFELRCGHWHLPFVEGFLAWSISARLAKVV